MRERNGFTLIELMIVVAIIGILASIAIPQFNRMLLRAKRSELPSNLDAIRTIQKAYHAEWGGFTSASAMPAATPNGRSQTTWAGAGVTSWELLGWQPDGKVRGAYTTGSLNAASAQQDDFTATAHGDVDGNSVNSEYIANRRDKNLMTSPNNVY